MLLASDKYVPTAPTCARLTQRGADYHRIHVCEHREITLLQMSTITKIYP